MNISKKDVIWSYAATFLKISASVILLPFILRMMPPETVGIWSIFMTITVFTTILDFGFNPAFTRNITYIFSGVKTLKINGLETIDKKECTIDYGLLKSVISVMKWFYLRIAIVLFLILATIGSYYIYTLLIHYKGNHLEVYISWALLCIINAYNLYTLYYDSLLLGKGLIKRSKQIIIIGQLAYLVIGLILIIAGNGLIAIISAQAISVIIVRWLSFRFFFNREMKEKLNQTISLSKKEVLTAISPNAIKIGITSIGGVLVNRSAIVIGSLYLSLKDIASYGITMQLISIIAGLAGIYMITYQPKIAQLRVEQNNSAIKRIYLTGQIMIFLTYIFGGIFIILIGDWALKIIGSQTQLLASPLILTAIIISYLENHHATAASILLSKNEVPFFKASIISGAVTILLLLLFFEFTNFGLWTLIVSQGIAQGIYQNWKWPIVVIKELKISQKDVIHSLSKITKLHKNL